MRCFPKHKALGVGMVDILAVGLQLALVSFVHTFFEAYLGYDIETVVLSYIYASNEILHVYSCR